MISDDRDVSFCARDALVYFRTKMGRCVALGSLQVAINGRWCFADLHSEVL